MNDHRDHIDETTLLKYYLNQLNQEAKTAVDKWLEQEENSKAYEQWVRIWQKADAIEDFEKIDVEANWQRFQQSVGTGKQSFWSAWKVAASLLLVAAFSFMFVKYNRQNESGTWINYQAQANDDLVTLSDGTQVWLKEGATIRYPQEFVGNERPVELTGEAYFDVTHNTEKPFKVTASETTTEVLGTSFNLRSASEIAPLELVLLTGKVRFSTANEMVILQPGQKVALNSSGFITKAANDNVNYLAWRTGLFVFENTSMEQVMADLANAYGFSYQFQSATFSSCPLTSKYEQESLEDIFLSLEVLFGAQITQTGDQVTIIGGQCN